MTVDHTDDLKRAQTLRDNLAQPSLLEEEGNYSIERRPSTNTAVQPVFELRGRPAPRDVLLMWALVGTAKLRDKASFVWKCQEHKLASTDPLRMKRATSSLISPSCLQSPGTERAQTFLWCVIRSYPVMQEATLSGQSTAHWGSSALALQQCCESNQIEDKEA
ncbi:hypothetical protein EYF80_000662 [Liparis tanakae]|uniref:Uncharacterized protein n=1 Tax=Liparis tanakae TaxID=230148 RepID=A0A4Z2JI02_9TELE|nr:hypothetical protein EYF80_000662 [Liparis tanakae]